MAAALLAALFAMGVFSATGVTADEHITVTAELVDLNDDTTTTTNDDTLRITVDGIPEGIAGSIANVVQIYMPEKLGADYVARWGVGADDQDLSGLTPVSGGYNTGGFYDFTFTASARIAPGEAIIEIAPGIGSHTLKQNHKITKVIIGSSSDTALQVTFEDTDGITISEAPAGPAITLSPGMVQTGEAVLTNPDLEFNADTNPRLYKIKVSGTGFGAADSTVGVTISFDPDGTDGDVTLDNLNDTATTEDDIRGGAFTDAEIEIPATLVGTPTEGKPVTIVVNATQGIGAGAETARSVFTVSVPPTPDPYTLSTDVATEAVRIELSGTSETPVPAGEDLTIEMKNWGLPSSIPESGVLILGVDSDPEDTREPYSGEPAEVRIEAGNKIVLSLTSRYVNGDAAGPLMRDQSYSVVFKKSAGITNPPWPVPGMPSS